jgi:hypothetical protein
MKQRKLFSTEQKRTLPANRLAQAYCRAGNGRLYIRLFPGVSAVIVGNDAKKLLLNPCSFYNENTSSLFKYVEWHVLNFECCLDIDTFDISIEIEFFIVYIVDTSTKGKGFFKYLSHFL